MFSWVEFKSEQAKSKKAAYVAHKLYFLQGNMICVLFFFSLDSSDSCRVCYCSTSHTLLFFLSLSLPIAIRLFNVHIKFHRGRMWIAHGVMWIVKQNGFCIIHRFLAHNSDFEGERERVESCEASKKRKQSIFINHGMGTKAVKCVCDLTWLSLSLPLSLITRFTATAAVLLF